MRSIFLATVVWIIINSAAGASSWRRGPKKARCLRQVHFDNGTVIIDKPGAYKLCEDITFKPHPYPGDVPPAEAFQPDYTRYNKFSYGLGFFAAISVATSAGVDLYLNGYAIEQSEEHALLQRFFAIIELGGSPFINDKGPAEFVGKGTFFQIASNVRVLGPGTLGRSSHHGIHGNDCNNIVIRDVRFVDFEVAAVSLNNVDNLLIERCDVQRNRHDVPIVGHFSAGMFIGPFGKYLKDKHPKRSITFADGVTRNSAQLYNALTRTINDAFQAIIYGRGKLDPMFRNPRGVVDGPCYAFLVHGKGPAVDDFGFDKKNRDAVNASSNVVIRDNKIGNIICWNKEVPAHIINDTVQSDARGSVLQLVDTFTNKPIALSRRGHYIRNSIADMQIFVAQAIHDGTLVPDDPILQTKENKLHPKLVKWATTPGAVLKPYFRCNGDTMHHVVKGITVIRVDQTIGFQVLNNRIRGIYNLSVKPFNKCSDVHNKTNQENAGYQRMGDVRGISVAASRGYEEYKPYRRAKRLVRGNSWYLPSQIAGNVIQDVNSLTGEVIIGIDIQGDTKGVDLRYNHIDLRSWKYRGIQYSSLRLRENVTDDSVTIFDTEMLYDPMIMDNRPGYYYERGRHLTEDADIAGHQGPKMPSNHPPASGGGGGCPFAHMFH